MTRLSDLAACFEGVIPSVIATAAADGTPNVSYLSHVALVDETHVALSNQFFAKTAANVRANRQASALLVDARSGDQYVLRLIWERQIDRGEIFDRIDLALKASSAQAGMSDVMRLRAVDLYRVESIAIVPADVAPVADPHPVPTMRALSATVARVAQQHSLEALFETLLDAATTLTDCANGLVLLHEPTRASLVTAAALGYPDAGIGSEVALGDALIGQAGAARTTLKINDISRSRRFGLAVSEGAVEAVRTIDLPRRDDALSQIAVPMCGRAGLEGVLFLESARRLAFDDEAAAALEALASQAAATMALIESAGAEPAEAAPARSALPLAGAIRVRSFAYDGSVFIDDRYVIKGVAGRLLAFLIERALAEDRTSFTNREIRRASELRLPEFKDNLESRLLLLARRLADQRFPIRLVRHGRGRMTLELDAKPQLERLP